MLGKQVLVVPVPRRASPPFPRHECFHLLHRAIAPRYHGLCDPVFEAIENGSIQAITSTLTLLEILVQPYRKKLDDLVLRSFALLTTYPNLRWIDLNLDIADTAARLRADHRLKTPDAIQAATAVCSGATGFICNDPAFKRVKEINTLLLDDCL